MSTLQLLNQRPVNTLHIYSNLRYDYNRIGDEAARERVRQAAVQIKPRLKRAAEDIFVIGQELVAIKQDLAHGEWGDWLTTEFGLSDRMARNFMNVALRLGGKTEKFSVLPVSSLYELAAPSTVDEVIQQVEGEIETGAVPSLTDIRVWKGVQRQQRIRTLTDALNEWADAQGLDDDETVQRINAFRSDTTEVPEEIKAAILDPTPKEIELAIAQSLAQRQLLVGPQLQGQAVTDDIMPRQEVASALRKALALLQDEKQNAAYARLTEDDPHLMQAIQSLKQALNTLSSADDGHQDMQDGSGYR